MKANKKNNVTNGLKLLIAKLVIIAMSICYVVGPSHNEIYRLLHALTHHLEIPDYVLAHSERTTGVKSYSIHETHEVKKTEEDLHHHGFLEFLEKIFDASDTENNRENTNFVLHKIDKHIKVDKELDKWNHILLLSKVKHVFSIFEEKLSRGYSEGIEEPPKTTRL